MGYSRRREAAEVAEEIRTADQRIVGITLGLVCATGMVHLKVACRGCKRKGRYRVTRLIDRFGAGMKLMDLKTLLTKDCWKSGVGKYYDPCGCYFPGSLPEQSNPPLTLH